MGQRRISALPPLRATRVFFPARLRPFFHPALPAIFLLIFPAVFRERTATGYGRPFGRTALSLTLPGRAGHAFRALPAGAVHPAAGGFLLRHGYSGSSGGACPTELVCPPPGRERRVHRPRHIPEPAAALVPCTSTRTAAGRPPPLRRLVRGGGRIHSRDGALSRGARFRAGTFGHGTGHGPPTGCWAGTATAAT